MTFKLSGRARDMNTTPKYTPVERAPKTYDDGNDFSLESRAGKRKFDQTKTPAKGAADDESGVKDEPLNETVEEVQTSPKKKKKKSLVQEEVAEVQSEVAAVQEEAPPTSPKKKKKRQSSAVEAEVAPPEEPQLEEAAAAEGEMSAKKKLRHPKNPSLR